MSGYEAFYVAVLSRFPGVECWVCDHLRELGVVQPTEFHEQMERERCRQVSGDVVDAHHVIPKAQLGRDGLELAASDPAVGIPVRRFHHDALERKRIVIPRAALPGGVVSVATCLGYEYDEARGIWRRDVPVAA